MQVNQPHIDEYIPLQEDIIFQYINIGVYVEFDKIFNTERKDLNVFRMTKKPAYIGKRGDPDKSTDAVELSTKYMNYFVKYYDTDQELLLSYLKIKYKTTTCDNYKFKKFKKDIIKYILSPTMSEKIDMLVKDNYMPETLKIKKPLTAGKERKVLELNHTHIKILQRLSVIYKMISPLITDYIFTYNLKNMDKYIYKLFIAILNLHNKNNINIYNKLQKSVESCINQTNNDKTLWKKSEIDGKDKFTVAEIVFNKLITDIIIKYVFDKNPAVLNIVALKYQIRNTINKKYDTDVKEISNKVNREEGLSGIDKLEIYMSKIDEGLIILSDLNIVDTIARLKKISNVKFIKDEVEFYLENLIITKYQKNVIYLFFAKYFNGVSNLENVSLIQYIKLIIIFKKILSSYNFKKFQYMMTGNIESRNARKRKPNKRQIEDLHESESFQLLLEKYCGILDEEFLISFIFNVLNNSYRLVDYRLRDELNTELEVDDDLVIYETIKFLNLI